MIPFNNEMLNKYATSPYRSAPGQTPSALPSANFLLALFLGPMLWLWRKAIKGKCDDNAWVYGSAWVGELFERIGGRIEIDGMENFRNLNEPCIFIANHMSTLETFLLPAIIRPSMPVTFVVKKSLTTMPVFGPIMRSRNPVVVQRVNPREDLAVVLEEGSRRLKAGQSLIVFPQHTRSLDFDPHLFNSIGIKLARKAGVPVVPLALKTDAWGIGKRIKEIGKIRPDIPAHFKFAEPVSISGNGKPEHAAICEFIGKTVAAWQAADGVNA